MISRYLCSLTVVKNVSTCHAEVKTLFTVSTNPGYTRRKLYINNELTVRLLDQFTMASIRFLLYLFIAKDSSTMCATNIILHTKLSWYVCSIAF